MSPPDRRRGRPGQAPEPPSEISRDQATDRDEPTAPGGVYAAVHRAAPGLSDAGQRTLAYGRAERAEVDELLGDLAGLTDRQLDHVVDRVAWELDAREARRAHRQASVAISTGLDWSAASRRPSHAVLQRRRGEVA